MSSKLAIARLLAMLDRYAARDEAPSSYALERDGIHPATLKRAVAMDLVYLDTTHRPFGYKRHLTHGEREERRLAKLRREMREQDRARYRDPDGDADLQKVWVVYAWQDFVTRRSGRRTLTLKTEPHWVFVGFVRKRHRRRPQTAKRFMAGLRRKLGVSRETPIDVMDLQTAQLRIRRGETAWIHEPPQHRETTRPLAPITQEVVRVPKAPRRRFRKAMTRYTPRETRFIALGRHRGRTHDHPLYLGPLQGTDADSATQEAIDMFGFLYECTAVPVSMLSAKLRGRIRRGRTVRAGVTRIVWPEPPERSAVLEMSERELAAVPRSSVEYLIRREEKALKREVAMLDDIELASEPLVREHLAVLCLLHDALTLVSVETRGVA